MRRIKKPFKIEYGDKKFYCMRKVRSTRSMFISSTVHMYCANYLSIHLTPSKQILNPTLNRKIQGTIYAFRKMYVLCIHSFTNMTVFDCMNTMYYEVKFFCKNTTSPRLQLTGDNTGSKCNKDCDLHFREIC